ncbi:MAG: hypothetical protein GOV00_04485 [Candidatus Altiarchaeota archaeon]|nr:hypothetical protein [Candidatus Altiarchaeota archaeon]
MRGQAAVVTTGKMVAVLTFSLLLVSFADMLFKLNIQVEAEAKQGLDPAFAYLHSIAMTGVGSDTLLHHLSKAAELGVENPEGVNLVNILDKYQETFQLRDASGTVIFSTEVEEEEESGGILRTNPFSTTHYAVPPGGILTMKYRWLK